MESNPVFSKTKIIKCKQVSFNQKKRKCSTGWIKKEHCLRKLIKVWQNIMILSSQNLLMKMKIVLLMTLSNKI